LFQEKAVNRRLFFACVAMLLLANRADASGRYQRAEDGQTFIWSNYPKSNYEATWSGDRDANGYAKGYGTLTWYKVNRNFIVGSILPNAKRTVVAHYSGKMTAGKLEGQVVNADPEGKIFHAVFVDGSRAGAWIAGPAPSPGEKRNERVRRAELVEAPAEAPRRAPDQPTNQDVHGATVVETPSQGTDSLRSLTLPPSSLRMGIVGETSRSATTTSLAPPNPGAGADAAKTVAALDRQYQAAVKANDVATMDRILADDFVLVTGSGHVSSKADLIKEAQERQRIYEHQEEEEGSQKVRVWGDTAVVTARLWLKGTEHATAFDDRLWFSDTYVRTPAGWRYVFGQASIPLPKADAELRPF
jgi:ketosteroid isomerase-like protein